MTPFGDALRFYCRHAAEMNYLCDTDEPDLSNLEDGARVLEMARAVGEQARTEAIALLQECADGVRNHFDSIGFQIAREPKLAKMRREWRWFGYLRSRAHPELDLECGVQVSTNERAMRGWFWRPKGKKWQFKVFSRLGDKVSPAASDPMETGGHTVHLPPVPIALDGPIERSHLVRETIARFQAITIDDVLTMGLDAAD